MVRDESPIILGNIFKVNIPGVIALGLQSRRPFASYVGAWEHAPTAGATMRPLIAFVL